MQITYQNTTVTHIKTICPDIRVEEGNAARIVKLIIGMDLFYLEPDAARNLAAFLNHAADNVQFKEH
jgi:hypothetical protein